MIGRGLEGCGPSQPPLADVNPISRNRRSGRPPGIGLGFGVRDSVFCLLSSEFCLLPSGGPHAKVRRGTPRNRLLISFGDQHLKTGIRRLANKLLNPPLRTSAYLCVMLLPESGDAVRIGDNELS